MDFKDIDITNRSGRTSMALTRFVVITDFRIITDVMNFYEYYHTKRCKSKAYKGIQSQLLIKNITLNDANTIYYNMSNLVR